MKAARPAREDKMINTNELAIADLFRHKILGIVSHQPDLREAYPYEEDSRIRVRNRLGQVHYIYAKDCEYLNAGDDHMQFWEDYRTNIEQAPDEVPKNLLRMGRLIERDEEEKESDPVAMDTSCTIGTGG